MSVLVAFSTLVVVIAVGYGLGRLGVVKLGEEMLLSRVAFLVANPCLIFVTVAEAEVRDIFSAALVANLVGLLATVAIVVFVFARLWRRGTVASTFAALTSGYMNAGHLGIPIAVYVVGNGAIVAPIILYQLVVFAPIAFVILDARAQQGPDARRPSLATVVSRPFRNPLTVSVLLGLAVSLTGVRLPQVVLSPIILIGGAAVPLVLLAYGISLSPGIRLADERRDLVLVSLAKLVGFPALVWLAGRFVVGLDREQLFAAVLVAALPTAQNVYVYAVQYRACRDLARNAVFVTTIGSIPVMIAITLLLH